MGRIEERLEELGLALPEPFCAPGGVEFKFELVRVHNGTAYVSGHGPIDGFRPLVQGKVGAEVTPERAYQAARETCLSVLASLKGELGELDRITGWLKLLGLVNSAPGFSATPGVINGFSDLVLELWGPEAGRHARSAIGAAELPFDIPVEVEAVVAIS
jgi:enamine deaminase RidA (YjgF/YER057c/UK114 family)